jgi:hypothetical protein
MKKIISILAASAFVFALSSCKKNYTCVCDLGILGKTEVESPTKMSKKDAETWCEGGSGGLCKLK